jgi:hypothetical protein
MRMSYVIRNQRNVGIRLAAFSALLVAIIGFVSCGKESSPTVVQKTFSSPDEAGTALLEAVKSNDQNVLLVIFGPDAKGVVFSGDAIKDKDAFQYFVDAYNQMHRWREIKVGGEMLYMGADNYVFPVPLGKNPSGQWYFDTAAGKDEILARRIGKDELTAIAACAALAEAQQQYFSQAHDDGKAKQYAQKLVSDTDKQNGLYWPAPEGQPQSPLAFAGDFAKSFGYTNSGDKPQPFNGYLYRILTKQGATAKGGAKDYLVNGKLTGGFAVLAYPAKYRNSGIMTFIVGPDGVVYQKNLGEKTADIAAAITEYNPGDGWTPAI